VPEYMPVPTFRYSLLTETHLRCACFQKYHPSCIL